MSILKTFTPPKFLHQTTINFLSLFTPSPEPQTATIPQLITINTPSSQQSSVTIDSKPISIELLHSPNSPHKGQNGRILLIGGSELFSGAPYFATKSAIQIGADLIQILCEPTALHSLRALNPDIMCHGILPSIHDFTINHTNFQSLNNLFPQIPPWSSTLQPNITHLHANIGHQGIIPEYAMGIITSEHQQLLTPTRLLVNYFHHTFFQCAQIAGLTKGLYHPKNHQTLPLNTITNATICGCGLGTDLFTLSYLSIFLPTLLSDKPLSPLILDANSLSIFSLDYFAHSIGERFQPSYQLVPYLIPHNNKATSIMTFSNTILTPNRRELEDLYHRICMMYVKSNKGNKFLYPEDTALPTLPTTPQIFSSHDKSLTIIQLPQYIVQQPNPSEDGDVKANDNSCHLFTNPNKQTSSSSSFQPPQIVSDSISNQAIALARFFNNITIYVKGEYDIITNGLILCYVSLPQTSPRRCGGQGDITAGLIASYSILVNKIYHEFFSPNISDDKVEHTINDDKLVHQTPEEVIPTDKQLETLNIITNLFQPFHPTNTTDSNNNTDLTTIQLGSTEPLSPILTPMTTITTSQLLILLTPPVLASILSSYTLKITTLHTFAEEYSGTTADKIINNLPYVLHSWKSFYNNHCNNNKSNNK